MSSEIFKEKYTSVRISLEKADAEYRNTKNGHYSHLTTFKPV